MSRTLRARAARTAVSYTTGVLIAALSIGALTSCDADHSQTVPAFERERTAADELHPHWVTEVWHGGGDTDTSLLEVITDQISVQC